jgi:uncharacterized protein (DUF1330 family)
MPAYAIVIVDRETHPERMDEYRRGAGPAVKKYGGKILTLPSSTKLTVEGEEAETIIVVEFSDFETAQSWYYSEDYQTPARIRQSATVGRAFLVDGIPPM